MLVIYREETVVALTETVVALTETVVLEVKKVLEFLAIFLKIQRLSNSQVFEVI